MTKYWLITYQITYQKTDGSEVMTANTMTTISPGRWLLSMNEKHDSTVLLFAIEITEDEYEQFQRKLYSK